MVDIPGITLPPVTPPQFQGARAINYLPPAIAGLPIGALVNLTVLRQDAFGNFLVTSPKGNFTLASNLNLVEGVEIVLQITSTGVTNNAITTNTASSQYLPNFQAKIVEVQGKNPSEVSKLTTPPPGLEDENFDAVKILISRPNAQPNVNAQAQASTPEIIEGDTVNLTRGTITSAIVVSPAPEAENFIRIRNQNIENINARLAAGVDDFTPLTAALTNPQSEPLPVLQPVNKSIKPADVFILRLLGVTLPQNVPQTPQPAQPQANQPAQPQPNQPALQANQPNPQLNQLASQPQLNQPLAQQPNQSVSQQPNQFLQPQPNQTLPPQANLQLGQPVPPNQPSQSNQFLTPEHQALRETIKYQPIVQAQPPQQTAVRQNPLETNPKNSQFSGVVMGKEANEYILKTPLGTIKADLPQALPKGAELSFQLVSVSNTITKQVQAPVQAVRSGIASNQLSLMQTIQILKTVDPANADAIIKSIIPQADREFPAKLFTYLNAVFNGDAGIVLTREVRRILEQQRRPDLIKRIEADFSTFRQVATDSGSNWNAMSFPVFDGKELNFGVIYYRDYGQGKEDDDKNIKRFVIEVNMTQLGGFQFDGFVREQQKKRQLDLYIRTKAKIPESMSEEISEIFIETAELMNITGQIQFQVVNDFEIKPLPGTDSDSLMV